MTIAIVFPGQGSQSLGMMSNLAEHHSIVNQTYAEAADAIGLDLWKLSQKGPEEELNKTQNTQPALLTASVATFRVLQKQSEHAFSILAGHSLGEYSALVAAGVIDFSDAVKLVTERGRLMQEAVAPGEGAMAAILGLEDEKLLSLCDEISTEQIVTAANFNSPGQIVIAGHRQAVAEAIEKTKAAGAKRSVMLPVSVPSHCSLMKEAADKFQQRLTEIEFKTGTIPVLHNVDAESRSAADKIKVALTEQLYQPVQWTRCVQAMIKNGATLGIECGPGKVLTGLMKRIDRNFNCLALNDQASLEKILTELQH